MENVGKKSEFAPYQCESTSYFRARLRDDTGARREIRLRPPSHFWNLKDQASSPAELHLDLKRAFGKFTRLQQRVLFRVLLQGQSIDVAIKRSRMSREKWRTWLQHEALPSLRADLRAYSENGKVVV